MVLDEHLAEAVDAAEWSAQIMCDRVAERFELLVRGFQAGAYARSRASPAAR